VRSRSATEFVSSPDGGYHVGEQYLVWCAHPRLAGTVVWGRVHEETAAQLVSLWDFEGRLETPYDSIIDLGAVSGVDAAAFERVAGYLSARLPSLAERVRRQALVRPPGMAGALVAGFYPTLSPGFEWRDFGDRRAALAWCLAGDVSFQAQLDRLIVEASAAPALVSRLRHHLLAHPEASSLSPVARTLGVSPRTLQRELHAAGSAFRVELARARVELAKALLADSDLKLELVALRVGCRSLPTFITLFRRLAKETPMQYRARVQPGR